MFLALLVLICACVSQNRPRTVLSSQSPLFDPLYPPPVTPPTLSPHPQHLATANLFPFPEYYINGIIKYVRFLTTALPKYNLQITTFNLLKCTIQWLLVYLPDCATITTNYKYLNTPYPLAVMRHSHFP